MSQSSGTDAHVISTWSAEFVDRSMEAAYKRSLEAHTAKYMVRALLIWIILLLVFSLPDWLALGSSREFIILFTMRLGQCLLLAGLLVAALRYPAWALSGWPLTVVCLSGLPLFFVLPVYIPESASVNFAVVIGLLLSMYVFLPNRIALINLVAVTAIAGTLGSSMWLGITPVELLGLVIVLMLPAVIGFSTALRINTANRLAFALLEDMKGTNASLKLEIERRKQLEAELEKQAQTDPLTGLSNRREYETLFRRELERCRRHGTNLVLGMIDLDHFKLINDSFGHDFGDEVLRFTARVLQTPLRQGDVLGRFGGEEFILILPDTTLEQAQRVAERMRSELEAATLLREGKPVRVTATIALTSIRPQDEGIQDSIRRADQALYDGKRNGRNRVMTSEAA